MLKHTTTKLKMSETFVSTNMSLKMLMYIQVSLLYKGFHDATPKASVFKSRE